MPRSFCRLWTHAVFVTKHRLPLITNTSELAVHDYLSNQLKKIGCIPAAINGTSNHVHLLFLANPNLAMAEIAKQVKGSTSHWINSNNIVRDKFGWNDGYSAFSVSDSVVATVKHYIANQKEHHAKKSFWKGYEELEKEFGLGE